MPYGIPDDELAQQQAEAEEAASERSAYTYRRHNWFDGKRGVPVYGIQVEAIGYEARWLHCMEDGTPLLFDREEDREAKLKEVRKAARQNEN